MRCMMYVLRTKPLEVKEQHKKQLREFQEPNGQAMLQLRARRKLASVLDSEDGKLFSAVSRHWLTNNSSSAWSSGAIASKFLGARCATGAPRLLPRFPNMIKV